MITIELFLGSDYINVDLTDVLSLEFRRQQYTSDGECSYHDWTA